jgi:hypothetical protein
MHFVVFSFWGNGERTRVMEGFVNPVNSFDELLHYLLVGISWFHWRVSREVRAIEMRDSGFMLV